MQLCPLWKHHTTLFHSGQVTKRNKHLALTKRITAEERDCVGKHKWKSSIDKHFPLQKPLASSWEAAVQSDCSDRSCGVHVHVCLTKKWNYNRTQKGLKTTQIHQQFKKSCRSPTKVHMSSSGLMKSSQFHLDVPGRVLSSLSQHSKLPRPSPFPSSCLQPSPERVLMFPPLTSLWHLRSKGWGAAAEFGQTGMFFPVPFIGRIQLVVFTVFRG